MGLAKTIGSNKLEIAFILPLLIFIGFINIYPIFAAIISSFKLPSGYSLLNYQILVRNNNLYGVIGNTVLLTALALTIEFALALATSLLLNRAIRGRSIFRTIVILPYGVSTVVSAIAFTFIFAPTGWYLNEIFNVLGLAHTQINWVRGPLAFLSIAIADSWKTFPIVMLILLAGLQSIPESQYEAAAVDGASSLQQFRHITLPGIYPFIMIALIIRAVQEFNILALPLVLVGYTPAFLGTLSFSIYETFVLGSQNLSSAAATVLLAIVMIFIIVYVTISNRVTGGEE
ncbi:hypothetical protein IX51_02580 [uncultured archaeon]|nr:hypothetical protein IX51_02580 [uncultured archaeon]